MHAHPPLPPRSSSRSPRLLQAVGAACSFIAALTPFGACTSPDPAPTALLRRQFPAAAAQILDGDGFLTATAEGIVPAALPSTRHRLQVILPLRGGEPVRLRIPEADATRSPVEVRIHEVDANGEGAISGRAVAYPRRGGTSFWVTGPGAAEEWLHLDAGVARAGQVAAAWKVEGATLRQRQESAIDVVDAAGVTRLSVTAPVAMTASGQPIEARLSVHGAQIEIEVDGAGEAVLVDPLWSMSAPLSSTRAQHTATLLGDGPVLVTGGTNGTALASVELYDPVANMWTVKAPMKVARVGHTATLLNTGSVLVTGGKDNASNYPPAELYEPTMNTWTTIVSVSTGRQFHTATLLPDGKVLVIGGTTGASLVNVEIFDPTTLSWTAKKPMSVARHNHTATLLNDGRVMVAGGRSDAVVLKSAEIYDPRSDQWDSTIPSMNDLRELHTATPLQDGTVLVAGGRQGSSILSAEIYDPLDSLNPWKSTTTSMVNPRYSHTATLLGDGRVLAAGGIVAGGMIVSSAEIYDPALGTWTATSPLAGARDLHTATRLQDGQVLVAAGFLGGSYLQTTEIFAPSTPIGIPCSSASDCLTGFCVDGVCCDTACAGGLCDACAKASGATADGICTPQNGVACDDGNACTQNDICQGGVCTSAFDVVCTLEICERSSTCDTLTGKCNTLYKLDGAPCPGGQCIAGGCFPDSVPSASTGEGGSSSSTGVGSSGGEGGAAAGMAAAGSGTVGSGAGGAGAGPAAEESEIRLRGGACSAGRGGARGAGWIGLGLLLGARARRRRRVGA